jgi:LmbE family N-acetylglucosaminyl deacetylase
VELNLTVSDRETGWVRHYQDPAFAATTGLDAAAFGDEVPVGDLLFVGAHPDDELLLAPLLGELCGGPGRACTLLVATRGEAGTCRLPGGCGPDLGAVREDELRAAATQLGAELVSWRLPDVVGPDVAAVAAAWGSAAGGAEALVANLADELRRLRPAAVFAFDPRHGSTCHPAHRVAGDLVLAAVAELGSERPDLLWLETSVTGPPFHFAPVAVPDRRLRSWDASRPRAGGGTAWDHLLELAAVYGSQFDPARLASLAAVPPAERRVHLGRAADPPALSPAPCSAPPFGAPGMPRPGRP